MFKELFTNNIEESKTMLDIKLAKEIQKKYKLKKSLIYIDDEFDPRFTYETKTSNGKTKIFVDTKSYSRPVFNYEYI